MCVGETEAQCSYSKAHKSSVYDSSPSCSDLSRSSSMTLGELTFSELPYCHLYNRDGNGVLMRNKWAGICQGPSICQLYVHACYVLMKHLRSRWGAKVDLFLQPSLAAGAPYAPLKILSQKQEWWPSSPFLWEAGSGLKINYGVSQCDLSHPPSEALPGPPHAACFSALPLLTTPVGLSIARKSRVGIAGQPLQENSGNSPWALEHMCPSVPSPSRNHGRICLLSGHLVFPSKQCLIHVKRGSAHWIQSSKSFRGSMLSVGVSPEESNISTEAFKDGRIKITISGKVSGISTWSYTLSRCWVSSSDVPEASLAPPCWALSPFWPQRPVY